MRGILYARAGKWKLAITDFSEAIRLNPSDPRLYAARAKAYAETGDEKKATADRVTADGLGSK